MVQTVIQKTISIQNWNMLVWDVDEMVLAPPLGHFGVNLRHISSTRHTHLSDIFPGCSHSADPELSLDFEPDTVFDLCALESAYMAEIKRYKSSIRIRIRIRWQCELRNVFIFEFGTSLACFKEKGFGHLFGSTSTLLPQHQQMYLFTCDSDADSSSYTSLVVSLSDELHVNLS